MKEDGVNEYYKIFVSHADALEDARKIKEKLVSIFSECEIELLDLSPAFITPVSYTHLFKDTAGPAMDILIKLMSVISLILAPVLLEMTPLLDFLFH